LGFHSVREKTKRTPPVPLLGSAEGWGGNQQQKGVCFLTTNPPLPKRGKRELVEKRFPALFLRGRKSSDRTLHNQNV